MRSDESGSGVGYLPFWDGGLRDRQLAAQLAHHALGERARDRYIDRSRERERERDRERQREGETETERDRETERARDR